MRIKKVMKNIAIVLGVVYVLGAIVITTKVVYPTPTLEQSLEKVVEIEVTFLNEKDSREIFDTKQGSGAFIDDKGLIITNRHVIANAIEIMVAVHSGEIYRAKVIKISSLTDLAIIAIDTKKATPYFRMQHKVAVGETVFALGSPISLRSTVTKGIVSYANRIFLRNPGSTYIQTDVAINPGNSGGPLINDRGELVGINTFIFRNTEGIGFAHSVADVETLLKQHFLHYYKD
jgi:S1-C subfamily serine protease